MSKPIFPLSGPIADSRRRLAKLEEQRAELDEAAQPDECAKVDALIEAEKNFLASFSDFIKERKAKSRPAYSVSAKGILQLLGLTVVIFIALGAKRHFFG
jgi:hypothetical protein